MNNHENRLAQEKSPYLLQHAHNPVDWYPWGPEAFEKAKTKDKPIFLSIGYSTCHWCHVMERESFENEEIARVMNENFVCIKVDREERPDVDQIYMSAVQGMTGSGGWPLSVFLTHDLEPFWGGTYFPPESRWGRPGFQDILLEISRLWREEREKLLETGREIGSVLRQAGNKTFRDGQGLSTETLRRAYVAFEDVFDAREGGFGGAPKFPRSETVSLLFRISRRTSEPRAFHLGAFTLDRMARGGIYDHLGGGFHRYSTDARWLIPHFEKMLYDNALLTKTYLEAYLITQGEIAALPLNPPSGGMGADRSLPSAKRSESDLVDARSLYEGVARETLDYVLREMTSPEGGFYSAQDADSEGEEGKCHVWTESELKGLLSDDEFAKVKEVFGVSATGNFEGKNILHLGSQTAWSVRYEPPLAAAREKLLKARNQRTQPHKDDKIIASWNGLMVGAMAFGAQVLGDERYLHAAQRAADFLLKTLWDGKTLKRRYREGDVRFAGSLDDYAFLIQGLLDLYETDFDPRWFQAARTLQGRTDELFWDTDAKGGGYFFTETGDASLISRSKEIYDGAVPSGNSVAALNLLRLYGLTGEGDFRKRADGIFQAFAGFVTDHLQASPALLTALDFATDASKEIVIAGALEDPKVQEMLKAIHSRFLPNKVLALSDGSEGGKEIPLVSGKTAIDASATIYVCEGQTCNKPVNRIEEAAEVLERFSGYKLYS